MQTVGGVGGDIPVDVVAEGAASVAVVGVREGGSGAGVVVPGQGRDVAGAVVGDGLLGEGVS